MEAKHSERTLESVAGTEQSVHTRGISTRGAKVSPRAVCSTLNRLIVAGRGEVTGLEACARVLSDAGRRARLRAQVQRRLVFRRDLAAAVTALRGEPAERAPLGVRLAAGARRIQTLLIGPHEGDAYAVCARATEATANAYAKALRSRLPADVTFGIERQYVEVEWDRRELRRLRWGASLAPLPSPSPPWTPDPPEASAASDVDDALALQVWSEEGGRGPDPRPGGSISLGDAYSSSSAARRTQPF
jgi:uncharacterized protein (TIGR02284 family)